MGDRPFIWKTTAPLSDASFQGGCGQSNETQLKKFYAQHIDVEQGDHVGLMCKNGVALLSIPIPNHITNKVTTYWDVLKCIEHGMITQFNPNLHDDNHLRARIYALIAQNYGSGNRISLISKFEQGKLTPRDLVRDTYHYFGNTFWKNENTWVYASDS